VGLARDNSLRSLISAGIAQLLVSATVSILPREVFAMKSSYLPNLVM
jgi:hypothetical protein